MLDYESKDLVLFCRCRIDNTTIYGTFCGYRNDKVVFLDEETNKTKLYDKHKIVRTYKKEF